MSQISLTFTGSAYNTLTEYASTIRTAVVANKNREPLTNLFFIFFLEKISARFYLEKSSYPDRLLDILNRINYPKSNAVFVKNIVASPSYSHNYILRNFNKYIGTNLVDYINSIKKNNAVDLIITRI